MKRSSDGSQSQRTAQAAEETEKLSSDENKEKESVEVLESGTGSKSVVENAQEQILEWAKTADVPERLGFLKLFLECIPLDSLKHVTSLAARSHALRMKDIEIRNSQISGANDQEEGNGGETSPKKRKTGNFETETESSGGDDDDEEDENDEDEENYMGEDEEGEEEEEAEFRGKIVFDYGHADITPPPTIEFPTEEEDTVGSQNAGIASRPLPIPTSTLLSSLPIEIISPDGGRGNYFSYTSIRRGQGYFHNHGPQGGTRGNQFGQPPHRYY